MGKAIAKRKLRSSYYNNKSKKSNDITFRDISIKDMSIDVLDSINVDKKYNRKGANKNERGNKATNGRSFKERFILKIIIQAMTTTGILVFCLCVKYLNLKVVKDSQIGKSIANEFKKNYDKENVLQKISNIWDEIYLYIDPIIPDKISNKAIATFSNILKKSDEREKQNNLNNINVYSENTVNIYEESVKIKENYIEKAQEHSVEETPEEKNVRQIKDSGIQFVKPTNGVITSRFGQRDPIFKSEDAYHFGTDIANVSGTPIYSSTDGTVTVCDFNDETGKYIEVTNGNITTRYCHLSDIMVSKQEKVNIGQQIGKMGNTGLATGSHLHFEIMYNRVRVDAEKILKLN